MPEKVREAELKGIVAFELVVTRVDAAFKLSQNRNDGDHARIIQELEQRGDDDSRGIAAAMRRHR
jgi:transcriptional regulator